MSLCQPTCAGCIAMAGSSMFTSGLTLRGLAERYPHFYVLELSLKLFKWSQDANGKSLGRGHE